MSTTILNTTSDPLGGLLDYGRLIRGILQNYNEAVVDLLERDGFRLDVHSDLRVWRGIMETASGTDGMNPTFDPDRSGEPEDAYVLHVRDLDGRTAAMMCGRYIETDDYHDYVRRGLLWSPASAPRPVETLLDEPGPSGRLSHCGGLWVDPAHRGIGLSWLIPRLNHAVAAHRWGIDGIVGVVFDRLLSKGVPTANYGVPDVRLCVDGWFWPTGKRERIYQTFTPADFLIKRTWDDLEEIRAGGDKKMRDFAPIARKRNDEAAVNKLAAVP
jgi:GNAT superfamily N-acetyltransferase